MITLITGQPGAGKTLRALYLIEKQSREENRHVYYSGIKDLRLEWEEMERPEEWYELPVGSIVVIDECQRIFRPRGNGSNVPKAVAEMETHRHKGFDIYLITQHPMLLDSNIRRLCGKHIHVMRAFGAKAANIHEWNEVKESCDKSRSGSITQYWKYPKHVFEWYHSAELHTHKFSPPIRILMLIVGPIFVAVLLYVIWSYFAKMGDSKRLEKKNDSVPSAIVPVPSADNRSSSVVGSDRRVNNDYLSNLQPRMAGLAHSAPIFDDVTKPVDAPAPVGCIRGPHECRCFTQQGSVMAVELPLCNSLLNNGFFVWWRGGTSESARTDKGASFK